MTCRKIEFSGHFKVVESGAVEVVEFEQPQRWVECDDIIERAALVELSFGRLLELHLAVPEIEIVE